MRREHRPLEHVVAAGIDLGAGQRHSLAQRLGELEQQFVHGYGPRQAVAKGTECLIRRLPRAVDRPISRRQKALAHGQVTDRGDGGGQHRQSKQRSVISGCRTAADAKYDDHVDGRNDDGEARDGDELDEDTARDRPKRADLARDQAERYRHRAGCGCGSQRSRPAHEYVQHRYRERQSGREHGAGAQPLHSLPLPPGRGLVSQPDRRQRDGQSGGPG
jgi:hypothetical protein